MSNSNFGRVCICWHHLLLDPFKGLAPINEVKVALIHIKPLPTLCLTWQIAADLDETPHFAASHLGLHYLQMPLFEMFCINALTTSP